MDAYIHIYIHIHTYINTVHIIHLGHHGIRTMLLLTVDVKLSPSNVALNHKNILTHTYTHTHTHTLLHLYFGSACETRQCCSQNKFI